MYRPIPQQEVPLEQVPMEDLDTNDGSGHCQDLEQWDVYEMTDACPPTPSPSPPLTLDCSLLSPTGLYMMFRTDSQAVGGVLKLGLNIDTNFSTVMNYQGYDLPFYTLEQIPNRCETYSLIADVEIPPDAQVSNFSYCSKASRVIISNIRSIWTLHPVPKIRKALISRCIPIPIPAEFRTVDILTDRLLRDAKYYGLVKNNLGHMYHAQYIQKLNDLLKELCELDYIAYTNTFDKSEILLDLKNKMML